MSFCNRLIFDEFRQCEVGEEVGCCHVNYVNIGEVEEHSKLINFFSPSLVNKIMRNKVKEKKEKK